MSSSSNERGECIYIPLYITSGSVQENEVEGVVLAVIQITGDPSAERTAPPRSTHVRSARRLLRLDPARGKETLMMMAPAVARRRGGGGTAALRQGFAKHVTEEEEV